VIRTLIIGCAALALAACHQKPEQQLSNDEGAAATTATDQGIKGVHRDDKGKEAPATAFNDPHGKETRIKTFAGKPTLVNLWASWCAPCVKELPTLDKLAKAEAGKLNVLAVSQDTGPHASVEAFLRSHRIETLDSYQDPKMSLSGALGVEVMPTTVLYDAKGKEVWRFVGDQDWTSPEAAKLLAEAGVATGR
jgi:thiol-disulfide isomerase/thioredoxin